MSYRITTTTGDCCGWSIQHQCLVSKALIIISCWTSSRSLLQRMCLVVLLPSRERFLLNCPTHPASRRFPVPVYPWVNLCLQSWPDFSHL
jgi:hypothetical protein